MSITTNKPDPSLADIPSGVLSRLGELSDMGSLGRNSWILFGAAESTAFLSFALAGVAVMAAAATRYTISVLGDIHKAVKETDYQSLKLHVFNSLPTALSFGTLSYGMVIGRSADLAGAAQVSATAGSVVSVAAPILAACNIGAGVYFEHITRKFKDSVDEQMGVVPKNDSGSRDQAIENVKKWVGENLDKIGDVEEREKATELLKFETQDPTKRNEFLRHMHVAFLQMSIENPELREKLLKKTSTECVEKIELFFKEHGENENLVDLSATSDLFKEVNESFRLRRVVRQIHGSCSRTASERNELERQIGSKHLGKIRQIFSAHTPLTADVQLEIMRKVYEGNYLENLKARFMILAGVIGIIGAILGFVLTGGITALPFVIGALVWIVLDSSLISKRVGNWFWEHRKSKILPQNLQIESDKPKMSEKEFWLKTAAGALLAPVWMVPMLFYLEGKKIHKRVGQYLDAREAKRLQANPYQEISRSESEVDEEESDSELSDVESIHSGSEGEYVGSENDSADVDLTDIPGSEDDLSRPYPTEPLYLNHSNSE